MAQIHELRDLAYDLLAGDQVDVVIGYEVGPRGRAHPAFVRSQDDVDRLAWNQACTHNMTSYLQDTLAQDGARAAVVVKPCDARGINVLLAEHKIDRQRLHIIGMACDGIYEGAGFGPERMTTALQVRCQDCEQRVPIVYDTLIGEAQPNPLIAETTEYDLQLEALDAMTSAERAEYWLSQFDRCIRCYACRQACPMCSCPTCLYERDDGLWAGMRIEVNEKRAFHLGRAYHLAGRCIGCDECARVCPVDIPIGLLNRHLAAEMENLFDYHTGLQPLPSPINTILSGEEGIR